MPEHLPPPPDEARTFRAGTAELPPGDGGPDENADEFRFGTAQLDQRDIRNQAYEEADRSLQEEQEAMLNRTGRRRRFMGRVRNIWRQSVTKSVRRQTLMRNAEEEMIEANNIHSGEGADASAQQADMEALMGRAAEGFLRPEEGEAVTEGVTPEVEARVKEYIRVYSADGATPGQLDAAMADIQTALNAAHTETIAGFSIEQLQELAANIKEKITEQNTLEHMLNKIEFYEASVRSGVRTEVQRTTAERALEWAEQHPRIALSGKAAALAISAAVILTKGLTSTAGKVVNTVLPGAVGAAMAGAREAKALQGERSHLERTSAKGEQIAGPDQPRRQELQGSITEKVSAETIIGRLEALMPEGVEPEDLTPTQVQRLLDVIAEIDLRERIGMDRGINLISFSSSADTETERFNLARLRARAEHHVMENLGTPDINGLITERMNEGAFAAEINQDLETKGQAYRELRRRRVLRAMARGAITGLLAGAVLQEINAAVRPDYQGVADGAIAGGAATPDNQTWLRNLLDGTGAWNGPDVHNASGGAGEYGFQAGPGQPHPPFDHSHPMMQEQTQDGHVTYTYGDEGLKNHFERIHDGELTSISDGYRLVHEVYGEGSNGGYISLKDVYGNSIVDGLVQGPNGLTPESIAKLDALGIHHNFDPTGDGGNGRLDIVVPPNAGVGIDANPGAANYLPPFLAADITGRRGLEHSPRQAAGPAPAPSPSPEPEPRPFPPPGQRQLNPGPVYGQLNPGAGPYEEPAVDGTAVEIDENGNEIGAEPPPHPDAPRPPKPPQSPPSSAGAEAAVPTPEAEAVPAPNYEALRGEIKAAESNFDSLVELAKRYNSEGLVSFEWNPKERSNVERGAKLPDSEASQSLIEELKVALRTSERAELTRVMSDYVGELNVVTSADALRGYADNMVTDGIATIDTPSSPRDNLDYTLTVDTLKITSGQRSQLQAAFRRAQTRIRSRSGSQGGSSRQAPPQARSAETS